MNTEWQNYVNQLVKAGLYTHVAAIGTDGSILGISSGFSITPEDIKKLLEIGAPARLVATNISEASFGGLEKMTESDAANFRKLVAANAASTANKPSTPVATIYGIVGSQLAIKETGDKIVQAFP